MSVAQRPAVRLLVLALAFAGLACTSARSVGTRGDESAAHEACFNVRRILSLSPLHERYVYLRLERDEHYLLTLDHYASGLPFATGITITGDFSRVCSETGATLTYVNAGIPTTARIVRVEAVASKEAAEKVVEDRTTPKPNR